MGGAFVFVSERTPGRISGTIGNTGLTTFDYAAAPSGHIHAEGRWASRYFSLDIDRNLIKISNFHCTNTYERRDVTSDAFVGTYGCVSNTRNSMLMHVPDAFFRRPIGEQVVFLTASGLGSRDERSVSRWGRVHTRDSRG